MEKKRRQRTTRLEDLIPQDQLREEILTRLYRGDPIVGKDGIFTDMLQAMVNASLEGEMDAHLEQTKGGKSPNRRNGKLVKQVRSRVGPLAVQTPRDREGTYSPQLVGKWERELSTGMDEVIIGLYARGLSVEDVRRQISDLYGLDISSGAISAITNRVLEQVTTWQQRPLEPCYAIIYLDAIHYKVRSEGVYINKAVYTVYGINVVGQRDVLGLYLGESEGSRQWGLILEDIKRRGVEEVFIFSIDGLAGFKQTIQEVFPQSVVQRCIVHMVRNSVRFVSYKDLRELTADLRKVYTAANKDQAIIALQAFGDKWRNKYKDIQRTWEANWDDLMAYMDFKPQIRRLIYTTNPVEALHRILRKVTKSKGAWINDSALIKQLYLILMNSKKSWQRSTLQWTPIQRDLLDYFKERYEKYL